jgi:hypothetical protein
MASPVIGEEDAATVNSKFKCGAPVKVTVEGREVCGVIEVET